MRQEIKELFEVHGKEYITPYYWEYFEKLLDIYLNMDPNSSVENIIGGTGRKRVTYYRFVKRFYNDPGQFWDLMQHAHRLNKELESDEENRRQTSLKQEFSTA